MENISFSEVGAIKGANGSIDIGGNPTSLQFGPDGRLYVAEQNGSVSAFTIDIQDGQYVATAHEQLSLSSGAEVVKSIQNHNDDGSLSDASNRQVTGIVVGGTDDNPVLYISSSDPRISNNGEINLDTNSGVISQVTWTGTEWDAVDIVRGLPRSEENHANNGLVLSEDGSKLLVAVGGNTNAGAPSKFFSYTAEYALSGTVLEIDLDDIASLPVLTDPIGTQGGEPRKYVYDLPTLDDPNIANDGVQEDANGMDVAGPWGGNDGLNQAILPADAPLRIFADGFRNQYDLTLTEGGQLYTFDNGGNGGLGDAPVIIDGEAVNQPNDGGTGEPDALFLINDGGYYGHPNATRSNQDQSWTVYNDNGQPDSNVSVNFVDDISALVPDGVDIQEGFLIDPSKFTGDAARLAQSGIALPQTGEGSISIVTSGTSSNGLVAYNGDAFGGAIKGDLFVAQFNGNVSLIDLSANGQDGSIAPTPGIQGLSLPLDVTVGPDGTLWVASLGTNDIKVFAPSGDAPTVDNDFDDDGLINAIDPFSRDDTNGADATLKSGETLTWDFDPNQDGNLPGPAGFGGGLTGLSVNGQTDYEAFLQSPRGDGLQVENVKFITAAGGGTTTIEEVSAGDTYQGRNDAEFLFQTGTTIAPEINDFTVNWGAFNPSTEWSGNFQQIGGYIGTGDQDNYLKIVAINRGGAALEVVLEDNGVVVQSVNIEAPGLIGAPTTAKIDFSFQIDKVTGTAIPTVTYETIDGLLETVTGPAINLTGTNVLKVIEGDFTIEGQPSGVALGLMSSNFSANYDTFQAVFDDITLTAGSSDPTPPPSGDGFTAEYFEIPAVTTLNDVDFTATPDATATVQQIQNAETIGSFWDGGTVDTFAARFTGNINVTEAGDYTFYLNSDDGSALFVNGVEVIDNDGARAAVEKQATIPLTAGNNDIEVRYFENIGVATLELDWEGPDTDGRVAVTASTPTTPPDPDPEPGELNVIDGTIGSDYIDGTNGNDLINLLTGKDVVNGSEGSDTIIGDASSYDQIDYDGASTDYQFTQNEDGTVSVVKSETETDTLTSVDGFWFKGEGVWKPLEDVLDSTGNPDPDPNPDPEPGQTINGTTGNDYLDGTNGDDIINLFAGKDVVNGSKGSDIIIGDASSYDQVDYDGASTDYQFTQNEDGTVSVVKSETETDTLTSVDGFWFKGEGVWKPLEDVLDSTGNPDPDPDPNPDPEPGQTINGTTGNDYLDGTNGDDIINLFAGKDVVNGSKGSDIIIGDASSYDQVDYDGASTDYQFTQNEDGTVSVVKSETETDTLASVDGFWFKGEGVWKPLEDVLDSTGNPDPNPDPEPGQTITGTNGRDYLDGTSGNDTIDGAAGRDVIFGSAGNDIIFGGTDDDYDQVDYEGSRSDFTFSNNADGTLTATSAATGTDILDGIDGIWFEDEAEWYSTEVLADFGG